MIFFVGGVEMLFSIPRHKNDLMCFTEKIYVSDKLHSGISNSGYDHEFNDNRTNDMVHKEKGRGNSLNCTQDCLEKC